MSTEAIEDSYPLAPMQAGMLFNSLRAPGTGVDLLHGVVEIDEALDVAALRAAWQRVVEHHPVLRSHFRWEGLDAPRQIVLRSASLPFESLDWSDLAEDERARRWRELLRSDRAAGFDLSVAPLLRVTLVRFGPERFGMLWPVHHALMDTLAMNRLLREVFELYDAGRAGQPCELAPAVSQRAYTDVIAELDPDAGRDFWRERLAGVADAVRLGFDGGEPPRGSAPGVHDVQSLSLSPEASARLGDWARTQGVSLNTLVQGAWALLLSRHGGERRVVFGAVKSCRRACGAGASDMVGLALNTLPFVVEVDPEQELLSWLADLRAQWTSLRAFEHSALVDMKAWAGLPGRASLFESVLCFDPLTYAEALAAQGGDWSTRRADIFGQPDAPLTLNVYGGQRFTVRATYDPRRLTGEAVGRLLAHFETLLGNLAAGAGRPVGELRILPEAERSLLLESWNAPLQAPDDAVCLHQLFEAQAAASPDAVALAHGAERVSYAELDARANRIARALIARGVGPDRAVGLCLERSTGALAALLGVLKAGGAYVPCDPAWPAARLASMARVASLTVMIRQAATAELVDEVLAEAQPGDGAPRVLCLDGDAAELAAQPASCPPSGVTPERLAYVLFTSGSTGLPKGVGMPHAPLVNLMRWQLEQSGANGAARTLQFSPLGFDVSCQEIFATLAAGGCLQLVDEGTRRDPVALLACLREHEVTRLFMPFIALQKLVETAISRDALPRSLREVITAGEQLQVGPALVAFFERLGDCVLVNQYGPTECHVVTSHTLTGAPADWPTLPPIGRPIANARAYVVDERLQLAPVGAPGELCLGGATVGRGYLGDAAQTAARFVPDPFDPRPGARIYRTGDLARTLEDGSLQFLGRRDGQVKLRGYRVELGEIESVLLGHPGVREAAALVREDQPGDQRLIAYVVLDADSGARPEPAELRAFLQQQLPGFMLPAAFVSLEALPLTPSGKLDRRALPLPSQRQLSASLVAPRNATEQALAEIWRELLQVAEVGVTDDFFELGGNSLLAMQVVSRLRDAFELEVPLQRLFEDPTIAGLGEHIETLLWAAGAGTRQASDDDEVFEL